MIKECGFYDQNKKIQRNNSRPGETDQYIIYNMCIEKKAKKIPILSTKLT